MRQPTEAALGRRWRLIDTPPAPGAWNMAVDEALAESVRQGGLPVLRLYRWSPRCLSLGRNQPARGRYDTAALAARGIDVVRRPTGGRAVLHDRELAYCAAVPQALLRGPGAPRPPPPRRPRRPPRPRADVLCRAPRGAPRRPAARVRRHQPRAGRRPRPPGRK